MSGPQPAPGATRGRCQPGVVGFAVCVRGKSVQGAGHAGTLGRQQQAASTSSTGQVDPEEGVELLAGVDDGETDVDDGELLVSDDALLERESVR